MRVFNPEKLIYYVYEHYSVIDGKVFYVGIGKKDRVFAQGEHRNRAWKDKVWKEGGFRFRIVFEGLSRPDALKKERELISAHGLNNLCNIVGETGNSTAFQKGLIPWNKGLTGVQSCRYTPVMYNGKRYDSVESLIKDLGIGKTTFYRRKRKGTLVVELLNPYLK